MFTNALKRFEPDFKSLCFHALLTEHGISFSDEYTFCSYCVVYFTMM